MIIDTNKDKSILTINPPPFNTSEYVIKLLMRFTVY